MAAMQKLNFKKKYFIQENASLSSSGDSTTDLKPAVHTVPRLHCCPEKQAIAIYSSIYNTKCILIFTISSGHRIWWRQFCLVFEGPTVDMNIHLEPFLLSN